MVVGTLASLGTHYIGGHFRRRAKQDEQKATVQLALQSELADVRKELRADIDRLERDLDEWKGKYYNLMEDHQSLIAEHLLIQSRNRELEAKIASMEMRIRELEGKSR